jgi:NAD-dependent SIR2 family protein deacetylase
MSCVYILGAGASAGYQNGERGIPPPTACTFFQVVGDLLNGGESVGRSRFSDLWAFLDRYYKVAVDDLATCELDIEEVMTVLDIGKATPKARRQLLDLIALTLDKIIYGTPCQHHKRLVNSLRDEDVIITFNWDLLVDNIVALQHPGGPDYWANLLEPLSGMPSPVRAPGSVPRILKLHGSMNWMTCRRCRKSFAHILQGKTAAQYHAGEKVRCQRCNATTEPLMIPPTLLKNYDHPVIKAVWEEAGRVLRQADEITVIGYSLPPTDFKAKWLFMESSACRPEPLRRLRVFDTKPESVKERLERAFHADDTTTETITGGIEEAAAPA